MKKRMYQKHLITEKDIQNAIADEHIKEFNKKLREAIDTIIRSETKWEMKEFNGELFLVVECKKEEENETNRCR